MSHNKVINWGILGTGKSAHNFAQSFKFVKYGRLVAVGSRDKNKANKFAKEFNLPFSFSSYSRLASNSEVDIVYVATPNSCHKDNALLCLNSGKSVLIEKPFAVNSEEVKILTDTAKNNNLFIMEAIWTRFIPAFDKVEQLIRRGEIGKIVSFNASLGQSSIVNKNNNLFNNLMGGGSLLDLGIYPIFWSEFIFNSSSSVQSVLHYGDTDVDLTSSIIINYSKGRQSVISSSIITRFTNNGFIYGTDGMVEIHQPLYCPTAISVVKYKKNHSLKNKALFFDKIRNLLFFKNLYANFPLLGQFVLRSTIKKTFYFPIKGNGINYMVNEVSKYLTSNKDNKDNKIIPLSTTMSISKIISKAKLGRKNTY
jgi:dihydrodiol dehydrogenase / D-xylose 1-dehydrogenase (NADP)